MKQKDDLFIAVLKYGKLNINKPILFSDLEEYLKKKGYKYEEFTLRHFFLKLFISVENPNGNEVRYPVSKEWKFYLESDGYFYLLEHEELKSARKSSFTATVFAIIAIVISIIGTSFSIYYSNKQMNTPTTIQQEQIQELKTNNFEGLLLEIKEGLVKKDSIK